MKKYDKIKQIIDEIIELNTNVREIYDRWDDYGAIPGCDCGCGGDSFDWDGQSKAYDEASEMNAKIDELYQEIKEIVEVC